MDRGGCELSFGLSKMHKSLGCTLVRLCEELGEGACGWIMVGWDGLGISSERPRVSQPSIGGSSMA